MSLLTDRQDVVHCARNRDVRNRLAEAHNSPQSGEGQFCHPGPPLTSLSRPVPRLGGTGQMPVPALKTCGTGGRYLYKCAHLMIFDRPQGNAGAPPPRPSCETTASTPAAAREAPKFSSALRAVAVVAVVECRYTYVAAQLSCRKKVHVARKNAPGRLESARRCVSKDVALQVWGRIRHTGRFSRFYAGQR